MLSPEIKDFGQLVATTCFRLQTARSGPRSDSGTKPQRRFFSKPAPLHVPHFHPAWSMD
jgi:hypothetical protein